MTKLTRFPALAFAAVAMMAAAANARAQGTGISVQAPKTTRPQVASGDVATMAFTVHNQGRDTSVAEPKIVVPAGWRIVMSPAATVIAPGEREIWLVSVKTPAAAAAGNYVVRLDATGQTTATRGPVAAAVSSDSVTVSIAEHHEVLVRSVGAPSYVMGGQAYTGVFVVHNLGNVAARFDLTVKSTQGNAPSLASEVIALAPGQMDTVKTSVMIPTTVTTTVEEVLLLAAVDVAADSIRSEASMQATVVPAANSGPMMWTVPAEVALRTATAGAGVSAFTASGYGKLTQGSDVMVDFLLRGPTGKTSMFGEQETYRLGLRNRRSSLRLGDDSYGYSRLLTSGGRGTGAEVQSRLGGFTAGAYVQRDRTRSDAATEMSAMMGTDEKRAVSASVVALNRSGSTGGAQALTVGANALVAGADVGLELAASDSQHIGGRAGRLRVNGDATLFMYDLSAQRASASFASGQQGSTDLRASLIGRHIGSMVLTANSVLHATDPMASAGGFGQRSSSTSLSASWASGMSVEAEHFDRNDTGGLAPIVGRMETMRLRSRHELGIFDASLNLTTGVAVPADSARRTSLAYGGSVTARLDEDEYVSVFADYGNGNGLGESGTATVTTGVNAQVRIATTTVRGMTFLSQAPMTGRWTSQSDLAVEQAVRRSTIALRARLSANKGSPSMHGVFLEVKTPLGLPTAPINMIGRARAEVIDVETGRGVAGALVRLGGQAAVTDSRGVAMFRDLKPGQYRALIDGAAVAGRVVATAGDVSISGTSKKPAEFQMRLSRGGKIVVRVRSFERTSATIANGGDTLTEVGAVGQVMVALVTSTDTLWQTSDERGRVDFGSVAPGRYAVAIPRYDARDHMVFARTEFTVDVAAGAQEQVDFKLVPEVRAVEFQGEAVLIAVPAGKTKAAPAQSTITGKPQAAPVTGKPDESPVTTKTAAPVTAAPVTTPARGQRSQNQSAPQGQRQQQNQM